MRVLIFHGYLLGGTGSNVYNARLAEALVRLGHEVHLLSQDRHPEQHSFVGRAGDWDDGTLKVRELGRGSASSLEGGKVGSCTVYRPNIGELLPVYVADRYEGVQARTFAQCSDQEIAAYIEANVAAVRELLERVRPQLALANHLVMGPVILARALRGEVPYAVKIHGSALEYTVKAQPERFLELAREGLEGASGVLVGSRHTALSLWRALGQDESLVKRTRLGPPGVDVSRFTPREPAAAAAGVRALAAHLRSSAAPSAPALSAPSASALSASAPFLPSAPVLSAPKADDAFVREELTAATALESLDGDREPLVAFVGKLIVNKGVDLLLAAWPLVLERVPRARLVVVGFGAYRAGLERLCAALAAGEIDQAREIATAGRALEGETGAPRPLAHLLSFLDGLHGRELERYVVAARGLGESVVFTGRLDHDELAELLPACQALVVPSTFPEAFGMVAAEAAACGALPVSAAHSGLAEVSDALARAIPGPAAGWLSFPVDEHAVSALAACLLGWLQAEAALRSRVRAGLVRTVRERWSWEGVAHGVISAAEGCLEELESP